MSKSFFAISILAGAMLINPFLANAADQQALSEIRFENHQFKPTTLSIPAGQKLHLTVVNGSNETIEFESFKLNREKVVSPGQTITVSLPALNSGDYDFYDDFHQDVPQGSIVAK